uniref:F-actin-capping protein subunit beta n=1 Tax=Kalanchoe fedtschenkoi TaxID=63787 RepID=A0A7N0TBX4_KALFE
MFKCIKWHNSFIFWSIRSPWSNKCRPPWEDGSCPSWELRKLEVEANDVLALYLNRYYEGSASYVYMWEDDDEGFLARFLIKKGMSPNC